MKFDQSVAANLQSALREALKDFQGNLGIVEAAVRASKDGKAGFLVWHYVYHNEISFVSESGEVDSLYTSIGDSFCEEEYVRLTDQYSLKEQNLEDPA